ncbi:MAG: gliding motility-associated C-terminal domain-containing protein [Flavobacteriales bacterium]|nr:gliding motility-associated C-terminal domain-containing protein [Flavobacteriales bacterium]
MKLFSFHKKIILITLFISSASYLNAQCFEIESVLVDACGSPEGENEMLRFKVGNSPLNSADISAVWASANAWLGICQNGASSNATNALNATITGCGLLVEPTNGVLPANASVLFLTSTDIDASANSFANLNDTLYVIFQCSGNTGGHFGNYSSSFLLRTVTISFSSPTGCSDVVTYNKSFLLNQNLQSGGNSAIKNGAIVNFDPAGNDTYDNLGCQAPFNPVDITAQNLSSLTICPGDSINLSSNLVGGIQSVIWTGNSGNFSNPNNSTTTYFSSINDITPYYIKIGGITSCNDTIYDSLLVNLNPPSNVVITEPDIISLCQGESITLHATGSSPFSWNTGATTDSITVNSAGYYFVSASGNCPSNVDSVLINISGQLVVTILEANIIDLCQGDNITLHANGLTSYLWSSGATTDSITINSSGIYTVTSNGICSSNTASTQVNIVLPPNINITEPDIINLCQGESITFHATGSLPFIWNTGVITDSITVNTAGVFYVSSSNSCFTVSDTSTINITPQLNITITEPNTTICDGETFTLHANGANSYLWSTGATTNSITVNSLGNYSVTSNGVCPSNSSSVQINVTPQIVINILEGNSTVICPNTQITLHAIGGNNYNWSTGETTDSIQINSIGFYTVEVTNGNCPNSSITIDVTTEAPPLALITGDSLLCKDDFLTLEASGFGDFNWSNGDLGNFTTIFLPQQIILTATNSCNNSVSDSITITEVDCNTTIYIPNTFTPNNDGKNDIFKIEGTNIQNINGRIFNRWGELLFKWDNVNNGWNGYYKGKLSPVDNYIYRVQIKLLDGSFDIFTGTLLLLK